MPYYKDPLSKLHYIDDDVFVKSLPPGVVKISDSEAENMMSTKKTAEELAAEALAAKKLIRQQLVDAITVTTSTGKVFDGNEDAQRRLNNAISVAAITGETSCTWVLANNVPTTVTLAEIKEAFALAFQAMGAIWATPYE